MLCIYTFDLKRFICKSSNILQISNETISSDIFPSLGSLFFHQPKVNTSRLTPAPAVRGQRSAKKRACCFTAEQKETNSCVKLGYCF